jgi:hypothetical protein
MNYQLYVFMTHSIDMRDPNHIDAGEPSYHQHFTTGALFLSRNANYMGIMLSAAMKVI